MHYIQIRSAYHYSHAGGAGSLNAHSILTMYNILIYFVYISSWYCLMQYAMPCVYMKTSMALFALFTLFYCSRTRHQRYWTSFRQFESIRAVCTLAMFLISHHFPDLFFLNGHLKTSFLIKLFWQFCTLLKASIFNEKN